MKKSRCNLVQGKRSKGDDELGPVDNRKMQMERVEGLLEELVAIERENGNKMDKLLDVLMDSQGYRRRSGQYVRVSDCQVDEKNEK